MSYRKCHVEWEQVVHKTTVSFIIVSFFPATTYNLKYSFVTRYRYRNLTILV